MRCSKLLVKYTEMNEYNTPVLETFNRKVFESGLIAKVIFLPDWQSSKGSNMGKKCCVTFSYEGGRLSERMVSRNKNIINENNWF